MKHVNLALLMMLIALAACAAGCRRDGPVPGSGKAAHCASNLRQIYMACFAYKDDHRAFPFAGEGARAHEHLQLLVDNGYIDDPELFVCPASKTEKRAEVDANGKFKLSENTCSYAYRKTPVKNIETVRTLQLLLADKHMVHEGINIVITNGIIEHLKNLDGKTWEELTNGEFTR
jgi:hypothetical protein